MSAEDQLSQIVNVGQEVSLMGETFRVKKFTLGPMTRVMPYLGPLAYVFRQIFEKPKDDKGRPIISDAEMLELAVTALSISGESVMGVLSVVSGKTQEELEGADLMESAEVFAAVVQQNAPLFSRQSLDRFKGVWAKVQAGMNSSTSSSNGATAPKKKSLKATPLTT
jgi:hypothetical protein